MDVIAIYGMGEGAALEVLSETGADLSKWPSAKNFVSWLNLCPNNKISGGKIISSMLLKKQPRVLPLVPSGMQPMLFVEVTIGWVITSEE